jgi:membrane fusion protein, multidrug efflux system
VLADRKGVTTVPQRTVMQGPGGYFAYIVKPGGTAERRTVELGGTQAGIAVILRGIAAGETVAVEGQYRLSDGARVQIEPPSPASAATASQPRAVVKAAPKP